MSLFTDAGYRKGVQLIGDANNRFTEWLYGPWTKEKYQTYLALNSIPGVSHYMDYLLDVRSDEEYLRRYGMDYSNIHDPRKLHQTGSSVNGIRYGLGMVSRNIETLYD